jgi:hypothetical protein
LAILISFLLPAKNILILAALLSALYLAGCKKNPVIWGTWTETSVRQVYSSHDSVTYDMTSYISGGVIFTFTVAGGYASSYSTGRYVLAGSTLQLIDTTASPPLTTFYKVTKLTDQQLVLQYTDTLTYSPASTVQYIYTLSPQ